MIKNRSYRTAAIATAAQLLVLCTLGITARAQTAAPSPATAPGQTTTPETPQGGAPNASGGELQQITVTGYLIPRVGEGPQPVATLNQDFIQKQAYQTVNDVLNQYPGGISQQNALTFAGNSNSPASSAFGLKGLPANFTLVLIDGYRYPAYPIPINSTETFVDINSIPLAAIDRIEILKDGGSATYGEDAVAGVVNLVLKEDYNGADIINYIGESQRGDFEVYHLSMTGGISAKLTPHGWSSGGEPDGKTPAPVPEVGAAFNPKVSIVATFDYYDQSPIDSINRWYAYGGRANYATNYPNQPVQFFPPNGSYFVPPSASATAPFSGVVVKPGTTGVGGITQNDFVINGTPSEEYIPNNEQLAARERRYGGTVNLTYQPFEWLKLYDHFIIQRNEETSVTPSQGFSAGDNYAPNQAIYGTTSLVIPANNPYNPFHVPLVPNGQAEYEFGPWKSDVIGRTFRNIAGATIFLPWNNWFIDANGLYGESDVSQYVFNAIKTRELQEALNGQLPQLPGVFFNPFTDGSTGAQPNSVFFPFLRTIQSEDNRSDLIQYTVKAGGTLWSLPSGDLTAAGGLEYRSESLVFSNDVNSRNNNITSADFAGHLFSGYRWIHSAYGELDIPLLGDRWSWPGLRSLQVILSERYDDYSHFGSAAKPKVAVLYKPFDDLTFRATYSENYVVPTLGELFSTPLQFQTTIFDPIKNASYNVLLQNGGNPNLKSQSAYGYYLEAVWTPASKDENSWWHWAKGFTAYFDWYQTEVHGVIGTPNAQTVVAAGLPGSVIRNSAGFIQEVFANYKNLGNLLTDGIEFGFSYDTKEYNWGKLEFDWNGAYIYNMALTQLETEPNGFAQFILTDLTDIIGGIPTGSGPDFKFVGSLFYSKHVFGNDLFRTGVTVNFISSELDQSNDAHGTIPAIDAALSPPGYVHLIGSWTTWDWQISYEFGPPVEITPETPKPGYNKEGKQLVGERAIAPPAEGHGWSWRRLLDNTTFTFGIKNIFDTRPPLQVATGGPFFQGYDTQSASPVQRFFYGQIEKKF